MTVSTILDGVGFFVGATIQWINSFLDVINDSPLLIIFLVAVPLSGLGIGLLRRLISVN